MAAFARLNGRPGLWGFTEIERRGVPFSGIR